VPRDPAAPRRLTPAQAAPLYDRSRAADWGLAREAFTAALEASVAHAFPGVEPMTSEVDEHLASLQLEDLALAAACAAGSEPAWEHFVREFRPVLTRAADAIDPSGGARELADALYADLYGLGERAGARTSLFRYFHGRSRLATWLRAVLAQRHIDRLRGARRLDPLPDDPEVLAGPDRSGPADAEHARFVEAMRRALGGAVAALAPRDRLRLSCYYAQGMTLAAIGRLLKEHEATVSRHLARTRDAVRDNVESRLRTEQGMDADAVRACIRSVIGDAGTLDVAELIGAAADRKNPRADRSRE
jgi:RNA polymerase sigma factor (sigma-70 family)